MNHEQSLLYQRGLTLFYAGRISEATNIFEHLTAEAPSEAEAHFSLAMCYLIAGDLHNGWREYQWRLKTERMAVPSTGAPYWKGESFSGKTILIIGDQGYGDAVQFVRYVRYIKARGGTVVLACHPELSRLLAGCAGVDRVISFHRSVSPQDTLHQIQIPLLSVPHIFSPTIETIPAHVPYLHIPPDAGKEALAIINMQTNALRIGLTWAGRPTHLGDRQRSMKLEQFNALFDIKGVKYFSLQKGEAANELKSIAKCTITDLDPYLGDFADTAAAIQALDLVISVDTAVAHVAGALARPVWSLIPFVPDWRWMLNREDSPWYPTMRLFRQPKPGDWTPVIARVRQPKPGDWTSVIARVATQLTDQVRQKLTT